MNLYRELNQFLAGILIMIYHLFVGRFMDRTSLAFIITMYIFILTMIRITGLPIDEETGHINEPEDTLESRIGEKFEF